MADPWRQHVVSRVLLRRWCIDGVLGAYSLVHDSTETPKGPKAFGFVAGYVAVEPQAVEELWATIENRVPAAFEQIDAGRLPDEQGRTALIDLCALHLARSATTKKMWENALSEQLEAGGRLAELMSWIQQPVVLRAWFEHETGLEATGAEAEEWARDRLAEKFATNFGSDGAGFRDAVIDQFEKAREWFGNLNLQVGHLADGELAIGDAPVTTYDRDTRRAGLLSGVSLNDANSISLPLGPHHVMDFSSDGPDRWIELDASHGKHTNARQVACASERVHYRPGSEVPDELREARAFFAEESG